VTADHVGVPFNPDATDSLHRPRRWARCEVCHGWLLRVSTLRNVTHNAQGAAFGERRTEWHHRSRKRS
jgi:hypothetical protein